jgi:hypothetical protein
LLARQLRADKAEPGDVASRSRETGHQTRGDGVRGNGHHDGDLRGRFLRDECRQRARDDDDVHVEPKEFFHGRLRRLGAHLCVSPFDDDVLVLDPSVLAQAIDERLLPGVREPEASWEARYVAHTR